jgi:serine/threonine protein kinase
MASFAQTLRSFRSGGLSQKQLIVELDHILQDGRADAKWMLTTLADEHSKHALPPELHKALRERIETAAEAQESAAPAGHDTQAQVPDAERTKLATAYSPRAGAPEPREESAADNIRSRLGARGDDLRIKGIGDTLNNRFELKECVGTGGMSTVYKALDRRKLEANDRNPYVAVKVLNLEFRAHPDSLIALQREAKKCQSLAHPNIVRVYDFDRDGATVYMTMEHLTGESLGRKIGSPGFKGMPSEVALPIINAMGKALEFAHECGIVHSDFKPANVFITDTGRVKVIDFGIARAFQRADDTTAMEATRFDPGSLGALTPTYASPEMLEHKEPDPRDDIYALACTTYEMLTGRHPFGRTQATAARDGGLALKRHKSLSRCQFKALQNALAFDRDQRTPTVARFLREINSKLSKQDSIAASAAVVGAVMLVGGGVGYYLTQPSAGPWLPETGPGESGMAVDSVLEPPPEIADPPGQQGPVEPLEPEALRDLAKLEEPTPPTPVPPQITLATITPLVQGTPCSLIETALDRGTVNLRGYARESDIARLQSELKALGGVAEVNSEITPIGNEKCDALELIAPYWIANRSLGLGASIEAAKPGGRFQEGDNLILNLATPAYESYVNVDYYSLDGGVLHLVPSPRFSSNQAPADYRATIGDLGEWTVAEPFGTEMVVMLATPEPLFDALRKEYEPREAYLKDLKERLEALQKKVGKERIAADLVLIQTQARH